jgi:phosphopantothenoylcysteine decarboxylase/phosphopantothenate--cysteine ligase
VDTPTSISGKRIVLGVCGGISAYKSAAITSKLAQAGAHVTVLMTEAATRFVTPLTFQSLSGNPVYTSMWDHIESDDPQHISTARDAHLVIVAPCTMDCMARLATGRTDDVVSLVLSAVDRAATPVLLAPAMNEVMWSQHSTQRNLETLRGDGFTLIGPDEGWQACRAVGPGRMSEPEAIFAEAGRILAGS